MAGEIIRPFAVVMAFGVFVATFSSIYVAGPILMYIESRYPRGVTEAAGRAMRAGADAPPPTTPRARGSDRLPSRS